MFTSLMPVQHADELAPRDAREIQPVKSADRVLGILEMLSEHPDGLTITEMSDRLNFPRSSTHGLVYTLVERGYVQSLPHRRGFRLGAKVIQLAMGVMAWLDVRSAAGGPLEELAAKTGETAFLAIPDAGELVYIDRAVSRERDFSMDARLGLRRPAHCTSLGKALLAGLDEASLTEFIERHGFPAATPHSIRSRTALARDLAETRERGYSVDRQEAVIGVCCVGAPIRDHQGRLVAAVSISTIRDRFQPEVQGPFTTAAAVQISQAMGWSGDSRTLYARTPSDQTLMPGTTARLTVAGV